jgi:hypothetical protein
MKPEILKKIVDWFIEDIKENIAWGDVDVISKERLLEIAIGKADSLIKNCF